MSFPLFRSPGTIAFLDDDPDYLDMLGLVLPPHWNVRLFLRPQTCINQLQQEPPLWELDAWEQQQIIDQWREKRSPLIPQILRYWAEQPRRYALTQVCVVDYSMPAMDGLQVLGELSTWPGLRVLLTGQADEQVAVHAFNRGLIEQFIPKQTPDISRRLIDAVQHLQKVASDRHSQIWRSTLSLRQNALLKVPSVARDLAELVSKRWVEYVVIGDPFGVLGMDAEGRVGWLQLEPTSDLAQLAELAEAVDMPAPQVADIQQGRRLPAIELWQTFGRVGQPEATPAFPLGRESSLLGAVHAVPPLAAVPAILGYRQWLSRQPERSVED